MKFRAVKGLLIFMMRQLTLFDDLILPMRTTHDDAKYLLHELTKRGNVIGTDEAGRGALAGPVVAAAVYLTPEQEEILTAMKLRDSKRITHAGREKLFSAMQDIGVLWCAYSGGVERIDRDNILNASLWTMGQSVSRLAKRMKAPPACVIVDGTERIPDTDIPQWVLVRADDLIPSVSAASVVAKVIRDRLMAILGTRYPIYDFGQNKGYPTAWHIDRLRTFGMSEQHRRTFCRKILQGRGKF